MMAALGHSVGGAFRILRLDGHVDSRLGVVVVWSLWWWANAPESPWPKKNGSR